MKFLSYPVRSSTEGKTLLPVRWHCIPLSINSILSLHYNVKCVVLQQYLCVVVLWPHLACISLYTQDEQSINTSGLLACMCMCLLYPVRWHGAAFPTLPIALQCDISEWSWFGEHIHKKTLHLSRLPTGRQNDLIWRTHSVHQCRART